ncbi:MAG: hypothetical protein OXI05_01805 [Bacteroidota bacterium]|nr:hypothetical protein [Bacteroidota bacterium]MXZ18940.1 hypothetical protein [Rhodothermaceae bacterium]MDE2644560.1 hypothetical protein [Bacteroidota bacterium]MYE62531.1 hypothetical protein [Rhodothermaceae bacterium]MYG43926.1 hypothetical protein [Rhodothermaceae bacterium]
MHSNCDSVVGELNHRTTGTERLWERLVPTWIHKEFLNSLIFELQERDLLGIARIQLVSVRTRGFSDSLVDAHTARCFAWSYPSG